MRVRLFRGRYRVYLKTNMVEYGSRLLSRMDSVRGDLFKMRGVGAAQPTSQNTHLSARSECNGGPSVMISDSSLPSTINQKRTPNSNPPARSVQDDASLAPDPSTGTLLLPPVAYKQGTAHNPHTTPHPSVKFPQPTRSASKPPTNGPTSDPAAYATFISAKACAYAPRGPNTPGRAADKSSTTYVASAKAGTAIMFSARPMSSSSRHRSATWDPAAAAVVPSSSLLL